MEIPTPKQDEKRLVDSIKSQLDALHYTYISSVAEAIKKRVVKKLAKLLKSTHKDDELESL